MENNLKQEFNLFYQKNRKAFFHYAIALVNDSAEAEDIVHTAMLKLIDYLEKKRHMPEQAKGFTMMCVKNVALDLLRKRSVRESGELTVDKLVDWSAVTRIQAQLLEHLKTLEPDQKEVIIMKEVIGYTFKEIGQLKGVSMFTAASWHRRGMRQLRKCVSGKDDQ